MRVRSSGREAPERQRLGGHSVLGLGVVARLTWAGALAGLLWIAALWALG